MQFPRKGYGRIFVEKEEDVKKVEEIMRKLDPDEFGWYYPTGEFLGGNHERLVTTFLKETSNQSMSENLMTWIWERL